MKKFSLTAIVALLLSAFSAQAQDSLIPVKRVKDNSLIFYEKEISRLLIPSDTEFGMICIPSLWCESSLTYNPKAHALVYIEADTSIWHNTYYSIHHEEKISDKEFTWRENKLKQYHAPGTLMYVQPIPDEMAQDMKKLWKAAIKDAKPRQQNILDGTGWEYFINGKRAEIQIGGDEEKGKVGDLINLTIELRETVRNHDAQKLESLHTKAKELRQMFK